MPREGCDKREENAACFCSLLAGSAMSNAGNVATHDADVGEFAVGQCSKFIAGHTFAVPGADVTEDVHWSGFLKYADTSWPADGQFTAPCLAPLATR